MGTKIYDIGTRLKVDSFKNLCIKANIRPEKVSRHIYFDRGPCFDTWSMGKNYGKFVTISGVFVHYGKPYYSIEEDRFTYTNIMFTVIGMDTRMDTSKLNVIFDETV